nr:precorrin-8X methylmutase [Bacillota bacterium]
MKVELQNVLPEEIEKRSFEIIGQELGDIRLDPLEEPVLKRVIHTTADFEYVDNLCFDREVVNKAITILKNGACIVTDTQMAKAGINKAALKRCGCEVQCFMSDEDVAAEAKAEETTRAAVSMRKAAEIDKPLVI